VVAHVFHSGIHWGINIVAKRRQRTMADDAEECDDNEYDEEGRKYLVDEEGRRYLEDRAPREEVLLFF
jgi:hypothetical protein